MEDIKQEELKVKIEEIVNEVLISKTSETDIDRSSYKEEYIVATLGPNADNILIINKINEIIVYLNNSLREHRI